MAEETQTWTSTRQVISYLIVVSFIVIVFLWVLYPPREIDPSVHTVVNMLLGALLTKFGTVVDFHFGSSQGEKKKDDAQAKMVTTMGANAAITAVSTAAAVTAAAEAAAPAAAERALHETRHPPPSAPTP